MRQLVLLTIIMLTGLMSYGQLDTTFATYSMDAAIDGGSELPHAEVGSALDNQDNTHIAWIKKNDGKNMLMYTVFDPNDTSATTTRQIPTGVDTNRKVAPYIITDANNNPHIAYIIKRAPNSGTSTGNYAVMYAGDANGDGTFEISQVSTNADNPDNNDDNKYNCYVNGRPNVVLDGSDIVVTYASQSINVYGDHYYIFARKNGTSWTHSQEFNIDELVENFSVSDGLSMPVNMPASPTVAIIDISDYAPWIITKDVSAWHETEITDYAETFANEHAQTAIDNNGTLHYFWYYDDSSKFCHTTISNGTYNTVEETKVKHTSAGNLFPATVDLTTGEKVYFYEESFGEAYMIMFLNGQPREFEIPGIGEPYGREALHANDGHISLVTYNESDGRLYITTNTGSPDNPSTRKKSLKRTSGIDVSAYPNPVNNMLNVQFKRKPKEELVFELLNIAGSKVYERRVSSTFTLDVHNFKPGTYLFKIKGNQWNHYGKLLIK